MIINAWATRPKMLFLSHHLYLSLYLSFFLSMVILDWISWISGLLWCWRFHQRRKKRSRFFRRLVRTYDKTQYLPGFYSLLFSSGRLGDHGRSITFRCGQIWRISLWRFLGRLHQCCIIRDPDKGNRSNRCMFILKSPFLWMTRVFSGENHYKLSSGAVLLDNLLAINNNALIDRPHK